VVEPPNSEKQALDGLRTVASGVVEALGAGPAHRRRLDEIDTPNRRQWCPREVIGGQLAARTVRQPRLRHLHQDNRIRCTGSLQRHRPEIEREQQVRLYENERELARFDSIDVAIVENQGIRPYTTRLVNEQFVDPDLVFLTNVREDHLDTLGRDRTQIARSLTRAVPQGHQLSVPNSTNRYVSTSRPNSSVGMHQLPSSTRRRGPRACQAVSVCMGSTTCSQQSVSRLFQPKRSRTESIRFVRRGSSFLVVGCTMRRRSTTSRARNSFDSRSLRIGRQ